jgi:hypothetical protein
VKQQAVDTPDDFHDVYTAVENSALLSMLLKVIAWVLSNPPSYSVECLLNINPGMGYSFA